MAAGDQQLAALASHTTHTIASPSHRRPVFGIVTAHSPSTGPASDSAQHLAQAMAVDGGVDGVARRAGSYPTSGVGFHSYATGASGNGGLGTAGSQGVHGGGNGLGLSPAPGPSGTSSIRRGRGIPSVSTSAQTSWRAPVGAVPNSPAGKKLTPSVSESSFESYASAANSAEADDGDAAESVASGDGGGRGIVSSARLGQLGGGFRVACSWRGGMHVGFGRCSS
ncbi:hypothetical protein M427DRAFT_349027 [Gonapodya prolifera JEL478]|uniref:Uncharacterized protein n=1 Tax=Gonapodya prolifera (strain JEL478) TaxID=1344416 RepID=A0A139AWH9_GONPJ|nr:hypothetical protein M427DRAFT_349027 [Gonapodya prolifera JEL478]|eukprot:KXS20933.1 hypothetical protein M427DRAFT_349027 [Gonapodya prolifera JEL478]